MPLPHGSGVTRNPLATHPASYNGGVRPTGSDRATAVTQYSPAFPMAFNVENPRTNQAEFGTPHTSAYGQALRAMLRGGNVVRIADPVLPQTRGGFRGFVGLFASRAAKIIPVVRVGSYAGQLPMTQQPKADKPYPWAVGPIGNKYTG